MWKSDYEGTVRVIGMDPCYFVLFLRVITILSLPLALCWAVIMPVDAACRTSTSSASVIFFATKRQRYTVHCAECSCSRCPQTFGERWRISFTKRQRFLVPPVQAMMVPNTGILAK